MNDFTRKEHAEDCIKVALFSLGRIRALALNTAERAKLRQAYDLLHDLQFSVNEAEDGTLKIKAE